MTRDQWLQERQTCIGASDAAAIMSESPWKSRYALWAEKVHGIETTEESERMKWGLLLEPAISDAFTQWAEENLDSFTHVSPDGNGRVIRRHPEYDFLGATLDRLVYAGDDLIGVLEIKTTDGRNHADWQDGPPLYYQIQVQHQLMVTGLPMGWIAVLIGGNQFKVFECPRFNNFIEILKSNEIAFWRMIENKTQPIVDGSDSTTAALRLLHPNDDGSEIELNERDWQDDIDHLDELKAKIKEYQADMAVIENNLKSVIGASTFAHVGEFTYSYKTQTRKAHEVKESTFRVLRRGKRKATK